MLLSQHTELSAISETLQIAIPLELSRYAVWQRKLVSKYETNQVIRALGTWLILKHDSTPGLIQQWNNQKETLLKKCKCTDSIFRHRLQVLQEMQLITFYKIERKRDSIKICSWEQLAKTLDIDIKEKFTIQYNINDTKKLHQWIIAAEIQDNKNRQDYKIITKLKKNPETHNAIQLAILARGADRDRMKDIQYFLSRYRDLHLSDFIRASEVHEEIIMIRPDNNRGVKGMANSWNAKHAMTASYWKGILKKNGIIDISRIKITSQERVRNKHCHVIWNEKKKQTVLCLCDQIEILRPWERTHEFKIPD